MELSGWAGSERSWGVGCYGQNILYDKIFFFFSIKTRKDTLYFRERKNVAAEIPSYLPPDSSLYRVCSRFKNVPEGAVLRAWPRRAGLPEKPGRVSGLLLDRLLFSMVLWTVRAKILPNLLFISKVFPFHGYPRG